VVVTIGDAATGGARTIAPPLDEFTKYTLSFSFEGPEGVEPQPVVEVNGGSAAVNLPFGEWTITATGYTGESDAYVETAVGSAEVVVVRGDDVSLTILLGPKTGVGQGQGTFEYSLKIPSGLNSSNLIISPAAGGNPVANIRLEYNEDGITGSRDLAPGLYLARIRLQKGSQYAGLTEALHIYSGLTSSLIKEFTDAEFAVAVSALDLRSLVPAPVVWKTPVETIDSAQYTGNVEWTPDIFGGVFDPATAYTATVTLAVKTGYTFSGVSADSFTHTGADTITNDVDDGVVTIAFPATAAASIIDIRSAADLAKIGVTYPLGGPYELTADITLSNWIPIGNEEAPFYGSFNGNGKKITLQSFSANAVSEKTYLGIFGYVEGRPDAKAGIKNLTIASSVTAAPSAQIERQAVGSLAGYAENTEIEGIALQGSLKFTATQLQYAGVGGIVGYAAQETVITTSKSDMNVSIQGGSDTAGLYAGGLVGAFTGGVEISNSHNTGNVSADCANANGEVVVGGIAGGSYYGATGYQGFIADSSSTGSISAAGSGSKTYAGGIAGYIAGVTSTTPTKIARSWASGTIDVSQSASNSYAGGIVAYNYSGALVSQSYFTGEARGKDYVGGIAGYNNSRIEYCYSTGTVAGNTVGGIVGYNNSKIEYCYSTGTATGTTIGGIVGYNESVGDNAVKGAVAFNPLLAAAGPNAHVHRIAGVNNGNLTDNYAWSGSILTINGAPVPSADGINAAGGAPLLKQPFDYTALGWWDFTDVWSMGDYGYPVLQWQGSPVAIPPQRPGSVTANPSFGLIDLSWAGWQTAGTSYEVWYHTSGDFSSAKKFAVEPADTNVTLTGLANSTTYYVWVRSKNSNTGTSELSIAVSAKTSDPLPAAFSDGSSWWGSDPVDRYMIFDYTNAVPADERWELAYQDSHGTGGEDSYGYKGFIKYAVQHTEDSGVIILEYHDKNSSPLGAWDTKPPPEGAKFAAVYYSSLAAGTSVKIDKAKSSDMPNVETVTLNEAIAKFGPQENRSDYYNDDDDEEAPSYVYGKLN
jgi:hypothetical protein